MWTAQPGDYEALFPGCTFDLPGDPFCDDETPDVEAVADFGDDLDPYAEDYAEDYAELLPEVAYELTR